MAPRTRAAARKAQVAGGWNVLPHGLASASTTSGVSATTRAADTNEVLEEATSGVPDPLSNTSTAEATLSPKSPSDNDENPTQQKRKRKRSKKTEDGVTEEKPKRQRKPRHPYGLTPGITPFPNHPSPTPEQAEEVFNLLATLHEYENTRHPETLPEPSLEKAGCGEVPSVLDALLRTVLSASTTFDHANNMLKALVEQYGVLDSGVGKGSINWEKVRRASFQEVVDTIKVGGLAAIKTKHLKGILDAVYEKNKTRLGSPPDPSLSETNENLGTEFEGSITSPNATTEPSNESASDNNLLSMSYMFGMGHDEAMDHFLEFPGVGVKTASCVILFCLQLPSFAVDTHVFRFCQWLRWVPEKCNNRDKVFMHCQVLVPDHLKYGLHQLFIRHGQTCHRCGASTAPGTKEWEETECPLESLLDRTIASKGANKKKAAQKKKKEEDAGEEDGGEAEDAGEEEDDGEEEDRGEAGDADGDNRSEAEDNRRSLVIGSL